MHLLGDNDGIEEIDLVGLCDDVQLGELFSIGDDGASEPTCAKCLTKQHPPTAVVRAHYCCVVLSNGVQQCRETRAMLHIDEAVANAWATLCTVCDQ